MKKCYSFNMFNPFYTAYLSVWDNKTTQKNKTTNKMNSKDNSFTKRVHLVLDIPTSQCILIKLKRTSGFQWSKYFALKILNWHITSDIFLRKHDDYIYFVKRQILSISI